MDGYPEDSIDAMETRCQGLQNQKWDNELLETTRRGTDATLQGANIEVTNESSHSVIVNGKGIRQQAGLLHGVTDQNGTFESAAVSLPCRNYVWRENDATDMDNNGAPDGYKNEGQLTGSFEIRKTGRSWMTSSDKADRNNVKRAAWSSRNGRWRRIAGVTETVVTGGGSSIRISSEISGSGSTPAFPRDSWTSRKARRIRRARHRLPGRTSRSTTNPRITSWWTERVYEPGRRSRRSRPMGTDYGSRRRSGSCTHLHRRWK